MLAVSDRENPENNFLANVLLQITTTQVFCERSNILHYATIAIYYDTVRKSFDRSNSPIAPFHGSYHRNFDGTEVVSLTGHSQFSGAVFMDLHRLSGHRIGTYMLNEVVCWAKQWSTASVKRITLLEGQASMENKIRRNQFYEQFGIVFDYSDPEKKSGASRRMLVSDLKNSEKWKENIKVLPFDRFLTIQQDDIFNLNDKLRGQKEANTEYKRQIKELQKYSIPYQFKNLIFFHGGKILAFLILSVIYFEYFHAILKKI